MHISILISMPIAPPAPITTKNHNDDRKVKGTVTTKRFYTRITENLPVFDLTTFTNQTWSVK